MFAAGDVTHISEQVLVHIGEGAKAAVEAHAYLLELKSQGSRGRAAGDQRSARWQQQKATCAVDTGGFSYYTISCQTVGRWRK